MAKDSLAVFGYEVRYKSAEDEFNTFQVHTPIDGRHYTVAEVKPMVFEAQPGWSIDASDPYVPLAQGPRGQQVPLNKAIRQGHVVTKAKWVAADGQKTA